jgi:hypothetical protein
MPRIEQTFLIPVVGCLACQLIFRHDATIGFSDRDASHATPKSLPRGRQSCFLDAAALLLQLLLFPAAHPWRPE